MPTRPPHVDALLPSILREEEEASVSAVDVQAALSDPVLRGIVERSLKPYERLFTEKGMERARRTLVQVFTTHPTYIAALAKTREQAASGATTAGQAAAPPATGPSSKPQGARAAGRQKRKP
jgi:hypothetical protein